MTEPSICEKYNFREDILRVLEKELGKTFPNYSCLTQEALDEINKMVHYYLDEIKTILISICHKKLTIDEVKSAIKLYGSAEPKRINQFMINNADRATKRYINGGNEPKFSFDEESDVDYSDDDEDEKREISSNNDPKYENTGLLFRVDNVEKIMSHDAILYIFYFLFHEDTVYIYLTGIIEYLTTEILELSGNVAESENESIITISHLSSAIKNDEELKEIFKDMKNE